jgi:WD40 repeat protein
MGVNSLCFYPDGKTLVSGGKDAHLNFWDTSTFDLIKSIPAHNYAIYKIAFHPTQTIFVSASRDKNIKIWNAETIEVIQRLDAKNFNGHKASVNNLYFTKNGDQLVSVSDDRSMIIWE